ncbi:glycosyltransferase family 2 protein [Aestuariibius insulae]|uniref:glycosyltransferase family 2 protein n=1 Tax=Aestuariibius insulae TaxID=2058287 RepID=UPI00398F72C3
MKDEAPYVLEWVAYHHALGFNDILILANDCTDGTDQILKRLDNLDYCTYLENIVPPHKKPHSAAMGLANAHPLVKEADFVLVLDADEFLIPKVGDNKIDDLTQLMDSEGWDALVISWRLFGSSGQVELSEELVTEKFKHCSAPKSKEGVKTLFKDPQGLHIGIHYPRSLTKNGVPIKDLSQQNWVNGSGEAINVDTLTWNNSKGRGGRDYAEIAHFMCKSLDEYMLKIFRGDGMMNSNRHGIGYWSHADQNTNTDLGFDSNNIVAMKAVLDDLKSDAELRELHDSAVKRQHIRLEGVLSKPGASELRDILKRSTDKSLSEADIERAKHIVKDLSPKDPGLAELEGLLDNSFQLSFINITTSDLPVAKKVFNTFKALSKETGDYFVHEHNFSRKSVSSIIEAIKQARFRDAHEQTVFRLFGKYKKAEIKNSWGVSSDATVVFTRSSGAIRSGYSDVLIEKNEMDHLDALSSTKGQSRSEILSDLISLGFVDDPVVSLNAYQNAHHQEPVFFFDLEQFDAHREQVHSFLVEHGFPRSARDSFDEGLERLKQKGAGKQFREKANKSFVDLDRREYGFDRFKSPVPLKVNWFRRGGTGLNFGDELGPFLVGEILERSVEMSDVADADVVSVGSVLAQTSSEAKRSGRTDHLFIWGSGLLKNQSKKIPSILTLGAVRGPRTRKLIDGDPDVPLGDPGILVSRYIKPAFSKMYRWGVVPHFTHRNKSYVKDPVSAIDDAILIDPTWDHVRVVKTISACEGIISSSLHGLIVADSYNIPCVWLDLESHKDHHFKFADYCGGVGRTLFDTISLDDFQNALRQDPKGPGFEIDPTIGDRLIEILKERFG